MYSVGCVLLGSVRTHVKIVTDIVKLFEAEIWRIFSLT